MLSDDEVQAALAALPAWSGDTSRIVRTVLTDPEHTAVLRAQVKAAADELDHHPVCEDVAGGTRFVVWSHDAGGVTERDPALAARIDAVVARLGL